MDRLLKKAKDNDTVTVSYDTKSVVYFYVVQGFFQQNPEATSIRLEALGKAVTNLIVTAQAIAATGLCKVKKIKDKLDLVTYGHN